MHKIPLTTAACGLALLSACSGEQTPAEQQASQKAGSIRTKADEKAAKIKDQAQQKAQAQEASGGTQQQ